MEGALPHGIKCIEIILLVIVMTSQRTIRLRSVFPRRSEITAQNGLKLPALATFCRAATYSYLEALRIRDVSRRMKKDIWLECHKCDNCKDICRLPNVARKITKIILKRVKGYLETLIDRERTVFLFKSLNTDQVNTVQITLQQSVGFRFTPPPFYST